MLLVINRAKTAKLLLLAALLATAGALWALTRSERLRVAETGAPAPGLVDGTAPAVEAVETQAPRLQKAEIRIPASALFHEYRLERDRARSAQIELLRAALSDRSLSDARREQLTNELFALLKRAEQELQAETLLKAKGLTDGVVVLSADGANVVTPDLLERDDAARVGELVARATGVAIERITIIDGASR